MGSSVAQNPETRAMSSIFISDIAHDISEENLKSLFSEVGQVINFRLISDKTPNKSKIAFCEYKDPEMAIRAIHSLNGCELKGLAIHVDLATSDKCRQEIERLQGNIEPVVVADPTPDPSADKAPEEISKAVASLPAEQMFELMKQMKICIENNPQEARNLLLQNPQLAYALLQAQVIMRIVDPSVATQILNRPSPLDINVDDKNEPVTTSMNEISSSYAAAMPSVIADQMSANIPVTHPDLGPIPSSLPGPGTGIMPGSITGVMPGPVPGIMADAVPGVMVNVIPPGMSVPQNISRSSNQFTEQDIHMLGDQDLRTLPNLGDHDMRVPPALGIDKDMRMPMGDQDFRTLGIPASTPEVRPFDPRFRNMQGSDRNTIQGFDRSRPTNVDPRTTHDPRHPVPASRVEDPRKASLAASINSRLSAAGPALQNLGPSTTQPSVGPTNVIAEEQEKAALIMQVLQLTDQQIAALPPEQRQSILVLKEQLLRSQMV